MVSLELVSVQGESDPIDCLCNTMLYESVLLEQRTSNVRKPSQSDPPTLNITKIIKDEMLSGSSGQRLSC